MKKSLLPMFVCGLLLGAGSTAVNAAETTAPAAVPAREKSVLVSITATVEAIDHATREVTLKGPLGNTVTFTVDPKVERLKEVKVGDAVTADYYISIAAELRAPTAEEEKTPLVILDAAGTSPAGTAPAAGGLRRFKVVTTVEGVDLTTETITIKGPRGNAATLKVPESPNLAKVKLGDKIVVTYTEALAISLEKAAKPHKK
jgi:Cu/Ag efflux protein CusF